ncbi:MAG: GntR family transcriptional regulator [Candidatus Izemoplasmatales bacterium]|jgi:GntR family transcriptional regulator|nr:GntR family transcriptional regulator [Candidatus Izemoplasmatales bacterium]NLF48179.1 GntR family transcriptional regulator [Acholeplasmataceae bacterium]MDD4354698.1 GntR family transcriptional regulator [Candidatus Izemoplasmatales bacterium]MDD4988198.1 GntR family transcriptional regulator [Candidatus Izemoplasmatales bacterium]MDD5601947.1 GntR family transcriptional regulator [Candidatus Izemoplasmatales bacterium]
MKPDMTSTYPFYIQIRNDLLQKIQTGIWKEGDLIPSEMSLTETYGVSRVTIRAAIKELVNDRYLIRRPGFGTVVYQNKESLSNFTLVRSFTNEMREMGLLSKTLEAELELISADDKLAEIFAIKEGEKIYNLRRVRGDTVPILYSNTYLLPVTDITPEVLKGSLYEFLAKKQVFFDHFEEKISAVKAPKDITAKLKIYYDAPQLKRTRYSYDERDRLIEYTETFYNSLLYEYRTSISYRKK